MCSALDGAFANGVYTGVMQVKSWLAIHDQVTDKLTSGFSVEDQACCEEACDIAKLSTKATLITRVTACIILSNI